MKKNMSKSQYMNFCQCPAKEIAIQKGDWPEDEVTLPMVLGTYVDKTFTEPEQLDPWLEQSTDAQLLFTGKGAKRAEVKKADALIERMRKDNIVDGLFEEGKGQATLQFEFAGVTWTSRLDAVIPEDDMVIELKTTSSMNDKWEQLRGRWRKVPFYHQYWLDASLYWEAFRQNYGREPAVIIVSGLISDKPSIDGRDFSDRETIRRKLEEVELYTENILRWKNGEIDPPRCRQPSCEYCNSFPLEVRKAHAHF